MTEEHRHDWRREQRPLKTSEPWRKQKVLVVTRRTLHTHTCLSCGEVKVFSTSVDEPVLHS